MKFFINRNHTNCLVKPSCAVVSSVSRQMPELLIPHIPIGHPSADHSVCWGVLNTTEGTSTWLFIAKIKMMIILIICWSKINCKFIMNYHAYIHQKA